MGETGAVNDQGKGRAIVGAVKATVNLLAPASAETHTGHMHPRLFLALIVVSALACSACGGTQLNGNAMIRSLSVSPRDIVATPLTVSGEAPGTWFFEASFPVRLLDENGREIAAAPAQAQSDWMTEEFVPFSVSLSFDASDSSVGELVFEKDNPSGLPELMQSVRIPVRFR